MNLFYVPKATLPLPACPSQLEWRHTREKQLTGMFREDKIIGCLVVYIAQRIWYTPDIKSVSNAPPPPPWPRDYGRLWCCKLLPHAPYPRTSLTPYLTPGWRLSQSENKLRLFNIETRYIGSVWLNEYSGKYGLLISIIQVGFWEVGRVYFMSLACLSQCEIHF